MKARSEKSFILEEEVWSDLAQGSFVSLSKHITCVFISQKAESKRMCLALAMECVNTCSGPLNVEEFTATDPASSISLPLQLAGIYCAREAKHLQNKDQYNYKA